MRTPTRRGLGSQVLHGLRQVKHALFVARKRAGWRWHMAWVRPVDPVWRLAQRIRPYRYDPVRYADTFLAWDSPLADPAGDAVPRRIFAVWTGPEDMSPSRKRGLESIRQHNPGIEVHLVTEEDLPRWIVPGAPLHPSYADLSLVHRADHLRAYLLHHHGGGYCDVKPLRHSWSPVFDRLDDSDAWVAGYTEVRFDMVARLPGRLGRDLVRASTQVLGNGAFVTRPGSPFTDELLREQHRRLDGWRDALRRTPGDARGQNAGYPVPWLGILGDITGPLCLKHQPHIRHDDRLRPVLRDYQ